MTREDEGYEQGLLDCASVVVPRPRERYERLRRLPNPYAQSDEAGVGWAQARRHSLETMRQVYRELR